jgi:hypothetical protein
MTSKKKTSKKKASEKKASEAPKAAPQEIRFRPARKANELTALLYDADEYLIECTRLHPRVTLERTLEPGQVLEIRATTDDEHAELAAGLA